MSSIDLLSNTVQYLEQRLDEVKKDLATLKRNENSPVLPVNFQIFKHKGMTFQLNKFYIVAQAVVKLNSAAKSVEDVLASMEHTIKCYTPKTYSSGIYGYCIYYITRDDHIEAVATLDLGVLGQYLGIG